MADDSEYKEDPMRVLRWWARWWLPVVVAVVAVTVLVILHFTVGLGKQPVTWVQVGVTSFTTVFIGVLTRNNSKDQAQEAERQSERQSHEALRQAERQAKAAAKSERDRDLRSRSSQLMSHQASAIEHLGAEGKPVVQAAGVNELIWLMRGWTTLTFDSIVAVHEDDAIDTKEEIYARVNGAVDRWIDHVQQLVDLVYKQTLDIEDEGLLGDNSARSNGFTKLFDQLTHVANPPIQANDQKSPCMTLSAIDLSVAELPGVSLPGVDLSDAKMTGIHLECADLPDANLSGANLQAADLREADLTGANLDGAHLDGALLQAAKLKSAYLNGTDLSYSFYDKFTELPDNIDTSKMNPDVGTQEE